MEEGRDQEQLKSSIREFSEFAGSTSSDRQRLIKTAIRVVIENLIPSRVRVLFNLTNITEELSLADIKKLFRMDKQRFEVEIKDPKYSGIDRLHYYMKLEPEVHQNVRNKCAAFHRIKMGFQDCIHTLIKTRNRILNLQFKFKE